METLTPTFSIGGVKHVEEYTVIVVAIPKTGEFMQKTCLYPSILKEHREIKPLKSIMVREEILICRLTA